MLTNPQAKSFIALATAALIAVVSVNARAAADGDRAANINVHTPAVDVRPATVDARTATVDRPSDALLDIKDTVKKSFKVRAGGTLFLDIDHGNVEVTSHSGNEVRVEVERTVTTDSRDEAQRVFDRHDLSIEERSSNVYVESRYDKDQSFWGRIKSHDRLKVHVRVAIPPQYDVDFTTGAGNVAIGDVSGTVNGRTGAGNIEIGAVNGPVDVASGSGNIEIMGARGLVEANTGAGNVEVREVEGEVRVNTGAGNIQVYITQQPQSDSRLNTGAGNVTVFLASQVGVEVDAEASMGSAKTDFPLTVEGKWMSKSFAGSVNGGGPRLRMRAGVGNVELRKM